MNGIRILNTFEDLGFVNLEFNLHKGIDMARSTLCALLPVVKVNIL